MLAVFCFGVALVAFTMAALIDRRRKMIPIYAGLIFTNVLLTIIAISRL